MIIFTLPFEFIGEGGLRAVFGITLLLLLLFLIYAVAMFVFRAMNYLGVDSIKMRATVIRKFSIAEHKEWNGKFRVTVPERKMIEIEVDGVRLSYRPAEWKFERMNERDEIEVLIQEGRIDHHYRVVDVGPL